MAQAEWVNVPTAAKLMSVHPNTVRAMIRDGRLPAKRLTRQFRIPRSAVVEGDAFADAA
jgi:excisionase family DNA binding protein